MEITQWHYDELKKTIEHGLVDRPQMKQRYEKQGHSHIQYARELFIVCTPVALKRTLNNYLNNSDIETIMLKILNAKEN